MAFIIWSIFGIAFVILGIYEFNSKGNVAFSFWANAKTPIIKDVKAYNRALGKLWIVFGVVFILLGIPLIAGQNSAWSIITILGVMFEVIITMLVYVIKIEVKYRE